MADLKDLRTQINEIDQKMASLFEQRMAIAEQVAKAKKENGLPIFDPKREQEVIEKNSAFVQDPTIKEYYVPFIQKVMNESKRYQERLLQGMKVAYSGVPGAFAYIAAKNMYPYAQYIACPDFGSAYKACETGEADICVLPIENSFAGDVGLVMDLIFQGELKVNRMYDLKLSQNLLGIKGARKEDIKVILSHSQAIAQSSVYLQEHGIEALERVNTAMAAKEVAATNDKSIGAIASLETAELYGLEVLEKGIETSSSNSTRFAALSRVARTPDKKSKMGEHFILVFTVVNEAGALAKALNILGSGGFNMRNLRSRPLQGLKWSYYFFLEIEGNVNSEQGRDTLIQLRTVCDRLKLVGSYDENEKG